MTYLLDTSALLAHYRGEAGSERVQEIFADDEAEILIATVSIPELARRLSELGMDEAEIQRVVSAYLQLAAEVVRIDVTVAEASYDLIRQMTERLPLIDALIAAAARVKKARLVHRDAHMRSIPPALLEQVDLENPASP